MKGYNKNQERCSDCQFVGNGSKQINHVSGLKRITAVFHFGLGILFMFIALSSQAQRIQPDTNGVAQLIYFQNFTSGDTFLFEVDSSLQGFQRRHTPSFDLEPYQDQGIQGTPGRYTGLRFSSFYFNSGFESMDFLRELDPQCIQVSAKPLSDLHYVQGAPEYIYLKARHSQGLGKYAGFGVNFRRIKANNIYFNNLPNLDRTRISNHYNTRINFHFHHPNNKYSAIIELANNQIRIAETGGLQNQGLFDSLSGRSRFFNSLAYLPLASNTFNDHSIKIFQVYELKPSDTLHAKMSLFHEGELSRNRNIFESENPDSALFKNFYSGSNTSDEQIFLFGNQRIGVNHEIKTFKFKHSVLWQPVLFNHSDGTKKSFHTYYFQSSFFARHNNKTWSSGLAEMGWNGYNSGNMQLHFSLLKIYSKVHNRFTIYFRNQAPSFQSQFHAGNHYRWDHKFDDIRLWAIGSQLSQANSPNNLLVLYGQMNQFVYFNQSGLPEQKNSAFNFLKIQGKFNVNIGHFSSSHLWVYQHVSSAVLPLPDWSGRSSFGVTGRLFEGNLLTEAGVEVQYFTSYYAPVYNPATRQFQLQNERKYGNYPFFDFYVNGKIKTLQFMLKYQHFNQNFMNGSSLLSPGYPALPTNFSFSIRWILKN